MSMFLNNVPKDNEFLYMVKNKYYVDKSNLIEKFNEIMDEHQHRFICITRPRRFGKSTNALMLASYYCSALDTRDVFSKLDINNSPSYYRHLNKHNVIFIPFNTGNYKFEGYEEYEKFFIEGLINDLKEIQPDIDENKPIGKIFGEVYDKTDKKFIFIIDEWDYIFNKNLYTKDDRRNFLEFLEDLLKDKAYVEFAYMTGILPIAKYSSGSSLNNFKEHDAISDGVYDKYYGFLENEVEELCKKQNKISMEDLQEWYNGYYTSDGTRIYNPRSVVFALQDRTCKSYWTNTGRKNELADYINTNVANVKEDIIAMMAGETLNIRLSGFDAISKELDATRNLILSALTILGFLSYHNNELRIPNKEIMLEFNDILTNNDIGGLQDVLKNSREMLQATIDKDTKKMEEIIEDAHNTYMSYFEYNTENSLSCIIALVYLYARTTYNVKREDVSAKGRADFAFYPLNINKPAFIIELKKDDTPENAIEQIKTREYFRNFKNYTGKKLLIGVTYDSKSKKHNVKIEDLV